MALMTTDVEARAEAAYWLARARLLLKRSNAVAEFEQAMPSFSGLPRAACWLVDLLWRAKRPERAEQIWKAVRASPRIAACEETPVIEARLLLWRGDLDRAEGVLLAASPRDVSAQADRLLYLVWITAARRRFDAAAAYLKQAETIGFYSASHFRAWRRLIPQKPETARPPTDVPLVPWLLHQGAMAVPREDFAEALAWVERAAREGSGEVAAADQVALPVLKHLARAQALASLARMEEGQPVQPPGLFAGAVHALEASADGQSLLDLAERGESVQARSALDTLADRSDLSPALAHHLALIYFRAAWHCEEQKPHLADPYWHRSWRCWLRWAAGATPEDRSLLFDWLLAIHRRRIQELLARDAVDVARRHWNCVMELTQNEELAQKLRNFRDQLATDFRLDVQSSLTGSAGHEQALRGLTRLLSLDRDNLSLLAALMEICVEWFVTCYDAGDTADIVRGVERFTPFALQLIRLLDQSKEPELTARAALAEFLKFRGFVATDPAHKAAHYREALRYYPANANVRELLAKLENDA
jgi:hypothetical protein